MNKLELRGEHITLTQALKGAGLVDSGGEAKHRIREGQVLVNGQSEPRPARKLRAGDRFQLAGQDEWQVIAPAGSEG
jgi:ribosome-associated protein